MRPDLAVVHLVWAPFGRGPLDEFVAAYRRHVAGCEHRLVVVCKGFEGEGDARLADVLDALNGVEHERMLAPAEGLDLATYRHAALTLDDVRTLCFLNSNSRPLADDWLAKLTEPLDDRAVALCGASGSWGSRSSHARYGAGLGGPYARVWHDPNYVQSVFDTLGASASAAAASAADAAAPPAPNAARSRPRLERLVMLSQVLRMAAQFPAFPAPHVRTNAFAVERELWLSICTKPPRDKAEAYRLESGRRGLTARIRGARRGKTLLVGADGHASEPESWPKSVTFWQGNQENLLIGDNQTRAYESADADTRAVLSGYAWGERAVYEESR